MTYNTGDIKFSRTLSESDYDKVKKFIAEKWPGFTEKYQEVHLDFNGVSLCGTVEPDIADFIEDLAKAVEPLGISLSGSVDCHGDTDGVVYIERDGAHYYGALDRWKKEATNQELLDVLRQRLDDKTTSLAALCEAQQREKPGMKEAASLSDLADVTFENNRLVLRVDDPIAARKFGLSDKTYRYEFDGRTMFWFYDKDESKPSNWGCDCGKGGYTLVDSNTNNQIKTVKEEMAHQVVEKKMLDIFGSNKQFTYVAIELNDLFYFDRNDHLHLR